MRNLRRAGTLKNSDATSIRLPRREAKGSAPEDAAAFHPHPLPLAGLAGRQLLGGQQLDPRHRGDRGQGLAAEAEGRSPARGRW